MLTLKGDELVIDDSESARGTFDHWQIITYSYAEV